MKNNEMRVLQIIPHLGKGGAERLVLDICQELNKREHVTVKLLTLGEENAYRQLTEGLDLVTLDARVGLSLLGQNDIDVSSFEAVIRSFRPDIIHSHLYIAELVSREHISPGVRYFTHFHDNMPVFKRPEIKELFFKKGIVRLYERNRMIKRYRACKNNFICISADALSYAKASLGPTFDYHLLHNAINFSKFYTGLLREPPIGKELRVLNTGSFVSKKNQAFLLPVIQKLLDEGYSPHLTMLGDGPLRAGIKEQVGMLGLEAYVSLPGAVDDVESYIQDSHIYLHSATYEPFGLAILEAMAGGLPVVCLDGGGNRDILEQGVNGFILSQRDPVDFATKILEICRDPGLYASMSESAKKTAARFDIGPYTDKLLDIYSRGSSSELSHPSSSGEVKGSIL